MKILVTGANGFLGYYLCKQLLLQGYNVLATGRGECRLPFTASSSFSYFSMDLADIDQTRTVVSQYNFDFIFHAAAIGKPDDFVFDGKEGNYAEDVLVNPINHYGVTKAQAELLVRAYPGDWSIVRTVLVYGRPMTGRSNLLSIVQEKLTQGQTYSVVDDQIRTPTYIEDLVAGLLLIMEKQALGIYHLCGEEILTPFEMAVKTAKFLGLNHELLIRASSASLQQLAQRPLITGLRIDKAKEELGFMPRSFEQGLMDTFRPH